MKSNIFPLNLLIYTRKKKTKGIFLQFYQNATHFNLFDIPS